MNIFNSLKLGVKLTGSFLLVALIIVAVAVAGYTNMQHINDSLNSLYTDSTLSIQQLGSISTTLYTLRGDLYKSMAIPAQRDVAFTAVQADITALEKEKNIFDAGNMGPAEQAEAEFWHLPVQVVHQLQQAVCLLHGLATGKGDAF